MKGAVSNIAWAPAQRLDAYALLRRHGICGLEVAPGLLFFDAADPLAPTEAEAAPRLAEVAEAGLELVSMQSLLFGVEGAALFEGPDALARLEAGMARATAFAGRFAIPNMVFGSPRQRVRPDGMDPAAACDAAAAVFARFGDAARAVGTVVAVEFNPPAYGTNFLTDVDAALQFVRQVGHSGVTLQLDIGAMHMNDDFDRLGRMILDAGPLVSHVHVSAPHLAPAPGSAAEAARIERALRAIEYRGWTSIEMRPAGEDLSALDAAVARLVEGAAMAGAPTS
ncbi:MAG: hydroxypyruvate isomerase [Planctomycetota bacterium]|jgi:hydroxypyruvate isomerase